MTIYFSNLIDGVAIIFPYEFQNAILILSEFNSDLKSICLKVDNKHWSAIKLQLYLLNETSMPPVQNTIKIE